MRKLNTVKYFTTLLVLSYMFFSCASSKKIRYFQDISDTTSTTVINTAKFVNPAIQSDDLLSVSINTVDPDATKVINSGNNTTPSTGMAVNNNITQQLISGYSVDKDGFINLPVLGKIGVSGLTTDKARDLITEKAKIFYKDPVVNVRFSNFRVTVIGEVNRPATYVIPNERVTVLDAIGYAGDLTIYGKRQDILVLRKTEDGKSTAVRLDITKSNVMANPFFFLRQNDVVYVEPTKGKVSDSDAGLIRYFSIAVTAISLIFIIARK